MHAYAVIEITFWHAMAGKNAAIVEQLTKDFNSSQKLLKPTKVLCKPNASPRKKDCLSAVIAGQTKNTRVNNTCGATKIYGHKVLLK